MNKSNIFLALIAGLGVAFAVPAFAEEHEHHEGDHEFHHEFQPEGHHWEHHGDWGYHEGDRDEGHWNGHGRRWTSRHWYGNRWVYIYPDEGIPYVGMINPHNARLIWSCGPYGHCGWVARW